MVLMLGSLKKLPIAVWTRVVMVTAIEEMIVIVLRGVTVVTVMV